MPEAGFWGIIIEYVFGSIGAGEAIWLDICHVGMMWGPEDGDHYWRVIGFLCRDCLAIVCK